MSVRVYKQRMKIQINKKPNNTLTDIPGLQVGHWTDLEAATGCTVILCPEGAVAGVDVRGSAPGTRETDLLNPTAMIQKINAILLSGGSSYGLKVPIVPAAILFDLAIGDAKVRPDSAAGYAACEAAHSGPVQQGNVGAGTGATVGKILGAGQATKAGIGTASRWLSDSEEGTIVAALVALNAVGEVLDPATQTVIAGARDPEGTGFVDTVATMEQRAGSSPLPGTNTTIAVVATNVGLTKTEATKVAQMAHNGLARTIRPIHTSFDGDTIFALSYGNQQADINLIGTLAADVLAEAVQAAVWSAETLHGVKGRSMKDKG